MRKIFLCAVFCGVCCQSDAESLGVLMSRTDWGCVNPQITGQACVRTTPPYAGVKIRFWQPVLLVETVKRPGDTAINEFTALTGTTLKQAAAMALGMKAETLDSGSMAASDTTSVQMNDVHVFGYPMTDAFSSMIQAGCEGPPDLAGVASYFSEMDAAEWRMLRTEVHHPMSLLTAKSAPACDGSSAITPGLCIGSWGPLYPRGGFTTGYSSAVGSAAMVVRAVDIASIHGLPMHQRVSPLLFVPNMFWDRLQMVYPASTSCLRLGEDPRRWENNKVSHDGKYVWIYWRKKECCAL